MGKADFGIVFEPDDQPFKAGSHLVGYVFADIQQEIKGSEMTLKFVGEEKTKVGYTTSTGKSTSRHYSYESRPIALINLPVSQSSLLRSDNGRIQPGKYKLPFDIELPASLPSSMKVTAGDGYCQIVYEVKGELKGSGMLWNYKCEQAVAVVAVDAPTEPVPFHGPPATEDVNMMCCFNRGSISLGATVLDTRLARGASTQVGFSCRNNSTVSIDGIEASLWQKSKFKAHGHRESGRKKIAHVYFNNLPGLDAKSKVVQVRDAASERQEIFKELQSGKTLVSFQVPPFSVCSYVGPLMEVSHVLVFKVETPCCMDNPTIKVPVQIVEGELGDTVESEPSIRPPDDFAQGAVTASLLVAPSNGALLGHYANEPDLIVESELVVEPDIAVASPSSGPSIARLTRELDESVSDFDIIESKFSDSKWAPFMKALSPSDLALVLEKVDYDQPRVTRLIASSHSNFLCDHVVKLVRAVSDYNRASVVEAALPHCKDLSTNYLKIQSQLSEWDQLVTKQAFERALEQAAI